MIDIGANLTNAAFDNDLDAILTRATDAGVEAIVVTGTNVASSEAAVALCARYAARLYCTVGVHPHDAATVADTWIEELERLASSPMVRAIGETGLDFNRNYSPHPDQHHVFESQLELAARLHLPVFVHDRDTQGAVGVHLARHRNTLRDVIVHCFTGDASDLHQYLDLDCHIGITGWICDERRGAELYSLAADIPDDRLLIESDAPYLLPRTLTPLAKTRRNEPANLIWVARKLAQARNQSVEHIRVVTTANARRVFTLD
jgi:TatD DNase family protein